MQRLFGKRIGLFLIILVLLGGVVLFGKETITFVDFSWASVQVHNRIAGFIIEHGYGYDVDYVFYESIPGIIALRRGDADVTMEIWVDNILETWRDALRRKEVLDLGSNYQDAPQGWYVPTYVIKGDPERGIKPMAPDLKTVFDLEKYWELFRDPEEPDKGRFYNGPSGWVVHSINLKKLEVYGLDDKFVSFDPGSQTSLATAILKAYKQGKPILAYYWEPTWIMGMLDMTKLEEPPYDPEIWNKNYGCAFPNTKVHIAASSKLKDKAPELITFLANYETTLEQTNKVLAYMRQNDATVEEAALWFLKNYKDVWQNWFPTRDPEIISGVMEALGEK